MNATKDVVVHIDRISKRFGEVVAVDNLDMKIMAGEFVTFLGPSGCGKSTTLRILGGFEAADQGRVILDGTDVTGLPPNKRNVNMVFQDYALFPHMTVAQNMAFGLELKGMTRARIETRLGELLDLLELGPLRDRMPDQISGGQRQRVALARALAPDAKLLLLDEPLGALDAKLRTQVQIELKAIQRRTGKTFFFVTHDQEEALTMSDRIAVMHEGKVVQDGTPEDLYLRPKNCFVAEFFGETNLIRGKVRGYDDGAIIIDWGGIVVRGLAQGHRPGTGQKVSASLRPESVKFSTLKPANGHGVKCRIINRVFKGSRTAVKISFDEPGTSVVKAYIDADTADQRSGDELWAHWDLDKMYVVKD